MRETHAHRMLRTRYLPAVVEKVRAVVASLADEA